MSADMLSREAIGDMQKSAPTTKLAASSKAILWPAAALGLLLCLQFSIIFTRAINWDEFFFYHEVAKFAEGDLARPLQTFHVRLFAWLPALHNNSVDAILTARLFMFAFEWATIAAIITIARRFVAMPAALLAAAAYLSAGFVFQHGMSFRVDPIITAALMCALAVLLRAPLTFVWGALFAALVGLAGIVSIKAILFAPVFAAVAWLRWSEAHRTIASAAKIAAYAVAAAGAFGVLYFSHAQGLAQSSTALSDGSRIVGSSGKWMFFLGIPPYWNIAVKAVFSAPVLFACIVATPLLLWRDQRPAAGEDCADRAVVPGHHNGLLH